MTEREPLKTNQICQFTRFLKNEKSHQLSGLSTSAEWRRITRVAFCMKAATNKNATSLSNLIEAGIRSMEWVHLLSYHRSVLGWSSIRSRLINNWLSVLQDLKTDLPIRHRGEAALRIHEREWQQITAHQYNNHEKKDIIFWVFSAYQFSHGCFPKKMWANGLWIA